jgi:hypothetical protein
MNEVLPLVKTRSRLFTAGKDPRHSFTTTFYREWEAWRAEKQENHVCGFTAGKEPFTTTHYQLITALKRPPPDALPSLYRHFSKVKTHTETLPNTKTKPNRYTYIGDL